MADEEIYTLNWNKYDWRTFEKICFEYIKTVYSAQFYKCRLTRAHKDQGRDIVIESKIDAYEAWGECKDHGRNIDLSVIGKNIVLALSHQINKAIFFSVTNITQNTKVEILNVAQKHGFEVLFMDGIKLNKAILSCKNVAHKYFEEEYEKYHLQELEDLWVDTCLSEYPFAEDARNNTQMQYHLENGFEIYLHVFLKNIQRSSISNIKLELEDIPDKDMLFYVSQITGDKVISPHTDFLCTFGGLILSPKKNIPLPDLKIQCILSDSTQIEKRINCGVVDSSDVWRVPYVNSQNPEFISQIYTIIEEVIPNKNARIFFLYGHSGMGKSRLMSEIENKCYENAYRVVHVDFREATEISCIQKIIQELLCFPKTKIRINVEYKDFKTIFQHIPEDYLKTLYEIMFYDKIDYGLLTKAIIFLLVNITEKDCLLLGLDNIQELSHAMQVMFWNILEHCKNVSMSVGFLFAQNIDRGAQENNVLINYLNNLGKEQQENYILPWECTELHSNDAIVLVRQLLHLTTENDIYLEQTLEKIGYCPMDLLLFAKALAQKNNLFKYSNSKAYISKPQLFNKEIKNLTNCRSTIIERNLTDWKWGNENREAYEQLFSLICFFDGSFPLKIFEAFDFSNELLEKSNDRLITKVNYRENTICFYHEKLLTHYSEKIVNVPLVCLQKIVSLYNDEYYQKILGEYIYFKALVFLEEKESAICLGFYLLEQYKSKNQPQIVCRICDLLLNIINPKQDPNGYFKVLFLKADISVEKGNLTDAESLFEAAKEIIDQKYMLFEPQEVKHFYHRYVNQKLHSIQYDKCLKALEEFSKIPNLPTDAELVINDRYGVVYYFLGRQKEALSKLNEVICKAEEINSNEWISIAYSDKAFTCYYNTHDINKICEYFDKAIYYYELCNDFTEISRQIEIYMQKALKYILEEQEDLAMKSIQKSLEIAEETEYAYLLIPTYNIIAFLWTKNKNYDKALNILEKALACATTFSNIKALISVYTNLGNVYYLKDDIIQAFEYYDIGYGLLKEQGLPQNSLRYTGLIGNLLKLSWLISKPDIIEIIQREYPTQRILAYNQRCEDAKTDKSILESFSMGVLQIQGFDYLY